jgi:hypothetical protein
MKAIVVGTGPSLTREAIELVNASNLPKFGCNLAYKAVPDLVALHGCNWQFWDYYWDEVTRLGCDLWSTRPEMRGRPPVKYIEEADKPGLSTDPNLLHHGHSSGYQIINLAYHYGVREFVLIGYDLRYPGGYNGVRKQAGSGRHFFGEYPQALQHWTRCNVGDGGELNGLLDCYRTIDPDQYGIRIVNCSPGSALNFFETGNLSDHV